MSKSAFSLIAGKAAAAALVLTIAGCGLAFADDTSPTGSTTPPTTTTVTPTPPPPVDPDGGHPWND